MQFDKKDLLEFVEEIILEKLNNKFVEKKNIEKFFKSKELLKEVEEEIIILQESYKLIQSYLELAMIEPFIREKTII